MVYFRSLLERVFEDDSLFVGLREDAFGDFAVEVDFVVVGPGGLQLHQVELVVARLHHLLPIVVVVVLPVLLPLGRKQLRLKRLLHLAVLRGQLHSLPSTLPSEIKLFA
jgi:hypothetical protein